MVIFIILYLSFPLIGAITGCFAEGPQVFWQRCKDYGLKKNAKELILWPYFIFKMYRELR